MRSARIQLSATLQANGKVAAQPISPLAGEMSGRTEGGVSRQRMTSSLKQIEAALARHGLIMRGALHLDASEASTLNAKSLVLIGHAGSSIWPHFSKWRQGQAHDLADPLDTWSRQVIGEVASEFGGTALFSSQRPYWPFQQWAVRAEGLQPSPLGILIHPTYGLWHAYRGAIVFEDEILIQEAQEKNHPCDLCIGKPCLSACPVGAFSGEGYDVKGCRTYLATEGGTECMHGGCKARLACPVGRDYVYEAEETRFHMAAFAK